MKMSSCTGRKHYAFDNAPRCGAKSKRNNGEPCRSPAVRGKNRCRMHGGSTGSGGQRGNQNALKHGRSTKEAKHFRRSVRLAIHEAKQVISDLND
jgi:hypothetical protein